ncbi:MAG TPA: hypothetical protein VNK04_12795 [Gemmataceae bacterium]|nr:hypothetical protein [Gemmataceae bacterium]
MEQEFLKDVIARLEKTGLPYALTGSIASNFWGIPRTTHDVDVVVVLSAADVPRVVAAFGDCYYVSEPAVRDAVSQNSMFNVIDFSTSLKADLWVTGNQPFNQSMLARRCRVEIVPGQEGYIGSPEDVLLHKLVWHTITPSERQLADAAGIAAVQTGKLDLDYMRRWAAQQGTADLLEAVLQGKYLKQT